MWKVLFAAQAEKKIKALVASGLAYSHKGRIIYRVEEKKIVVVVVVVVVKVTATHDYSKE